MTNETNKFGYPVRHKKKVPFTPIVNISPEIAKMNIEIFRLEEELDRFILSADDYADLVTEAFASNIHISIQMEGNPLSKKDVRRITKGAIKRELRQQGLNFPRQEVLNHIVAYNSPYFQTPWTNTTMTNIHEILMHGDPDHKIGEYRKEYTAVFSTAGQELFIPAPFQHIEEEMGSLLNWLGNYGSALYPIIAGSIFFHEFESIHPFEDGNGRCGRSLFHIYLQHNGLPNSKLCFIEQYVVADLERYYELMAKTDHFGDYSELIEHFTRGVHKSYKEAVERYREKDLLSTGLDETSKRVLIKAKQYGYWFSLEQAKGWIDNLSDYRLRVRLTELVETGALIQKGSTRDKKYKFADPLEDIGSWNVGE